MRLVRGTAAGVLVCSLALAGCTGGGKAGPMDTGTPHAVVTPRLSPAPTPTPTVEVTTDPKQAAQAVFEAFNAAQNASAQDYYHGWDTKVLVLLSGSAYDEFSAQGQQYGGTHHQRGDEPTKVLGFDQVDADRVVMSVCIDDTGASIVGPGDAVVVPTDPQPYVYSVTVLRTVLAADATSPDPYGHDWWRVDQETREEGKACQV